MDFGATTPRLFDTSTAGTGKTLAHLTILNERFERENLSRGLIICPKTLMKSAWAAELDEYYPDISYSLAFAPEETRLEAIDSKSDLVVINTDALVWLAQYGKRWFKKKFGTKASVLIDESSWIKNPSSQRTKAALDVADKFEFRTCMSGTPAPLSVVELWPQVKFLDDGKRLGTRFAAFKREMRRKTVDPKTGWPKEIDKEDARLITAYLVRDITIGHPFDEVMKHVPGMDQRVIWYDLPDKHRDVYKELEKKSRLVFSDASVTAVNAGVLANKLLQCASGAVYTDPTNEERGHKVVDTGRYELVADLAEAREQTVVFFMWRHQRDALIRQLDARKMAWGLLDSSVPSADQRDQYIRAFQAGDLRVLLMHYNTGAFGLTLTKARTVIWCSPIYQADKKEQGDARIRRGRQDQPTESIVILARETKDEHAYEVFTGNKTFMDAMAELLQQSRIEPE